MKKILIGTATYNEAKNISSFIAKIKKLKLNLDILIIDDNSPDKTGSILKEFSNQKQIIYISRKKKLGLDTAHKKIYNFALKEKYDYLITMDADLSHDPNKIPQFLKNIKKFDCVVGSRYIKGGRNDLKGYRYLISKFGNIFIKKMLNINLSEYTTSYRCFNLTKLKKFNLNNVKAKGYSFFMYTIFLLDKKGYSIKEIPIIFYERRHGNSKIPKFEIFRTLITLLFIKLKILD